MIINANRTAPLLAVQDLVTRYGTDTYPLRGVSLSLAHGEALGIVGESGSGKSVLLKSIIGVHPRTADPTVTGEVLLSGESLLHASDDHRQQILGSTIGVIHQDPLTSLNPLKRALDQVLEAPRNHGVKMSSRAWRDMARQALTDVGFPEPDDVLHKYPPRDVGRPAPTGWYRRGNHRRQHSSSPTSRPPRWT